MRACLWKGEKKKEIVATPKGQSEIGKRKNSNYKTETGFILIQILSSLGNGNNPGRKNA